MVEVPAGTLVERLEQLAAIHARNGRLCAPPFTGNRAVLEASSRHQLIHEQAAADLREAAALLAARAESLGK